jgi:glutathione S-transferase
MTTMTSDVKLHYFHGRGIGELIRLLLTVGEVKFADHRYTVDEFANMAAFKAQLPFGQMPALDVDGVFLGQTDSIARLAARLAGLYPSDHLEAACSDMIVIHQAEIQSAIAKMSFDGVPGTPEMKMVPQEERQKRVAAFCETKLPGLLLRLEHLAREFFMVGSQLSWADISIFNRLNQLLDMNENVLQPDFPKLQAVYESVEALPQIQSWMQMHKDDYPRYKAGG